jgi:hypothetical protein
MKKLLGFLTFLVMLGYLCLVSLIYAHDAKVLKTNVNCDGGRGGIPPSGLVSMTAP